MGNAIRWNSIWTRVWHLVELVNSGGGNWEWAASGMTRSGREVWRFWSAAANHPSPSRDGDGTFLG